MRYCGIVSPVISWNTRDRWYGEQPMVRAISTTDLAPGTVDQFARLGHRATTRLAGCAPRVGVEAVVLLLHAPPDEFESECFECDVVGAEALAAHESKVSEGHRRGHGERRHLGDLIEYARANRRGRPRRT